MIIYSCHVEWDQRRRKKIWPDCTRVGRQSWTTDKTSAVHQLFPMTINEFFWMDELLPDLSWSLIITKNTNASLFSPHYLPFAGLPPQAEWTILVSLSNLVLCFSSCSIMAFVWESKKSKILHLHKFMQPDARTWSYKIPFVPNYLLNE